MTRGSHADEGRRTPGTDSTSPYHFIGPLRPRGYPLRASALGELGQDTLELGEELLDLRASPPLPHLAQRLRWVARRIVVLGREWPETGAQRLMEVGGILESVADTLAREGVAQPVKFHDIGRRLVVTGRQFLIMSHESSP